MKKLFISVIAIFLMLSLAACGEKQTSAAAKPVSEPTPVSEVAPTPAPVSTPVEPAPAPEPEPVSEPAPISEPAPASEPEPVSEPAPAPTPSDPYAMLEVSLDWAKQHPQVYIKKANGKIYATQYIPIENSANVGSGIKVRDTYAIQYPIADGGVIMFGDFPILTVENGDELISTGFDDAVIWEIDTQNAGYTFPMADTFNHGKNIFDVDRGAIVEALSGSEKQFEIHDDKGNLISAEERFHLERGTKCTISWFVGTDYQERQMVANYRCITKDMQISDAVSLNSTMEKDGYAKYDISGFESGDYCVDAVWIHIA